MTPVDPWTWLVARSGVYWTEALEASPISPVEIEKRIVRISPVRPDRPGASEKDNRRATLDMALARLCKQHRGGRKGLA